MQPLVRKVALHSAGGGSKFIEAKEHPEDSKTLSVRDL